jgi:hypothetical protein
MRRVPFVAVAVALAATTACRPKGSDKKPTVEQGSLDDILIKHPTFIEARLTPKATHDGSKWPLKLEYSSMPDKTAIVIEGRTIPLKRGSGDVPTSIDLATSIGDAPIGTITGGAPPIPVNVPFELTFFDKRQKVTHVITQMRVWLELRSCLYTPPCAFPNDAAPNPKANIIHFAKGDSLGAKQIGSATKVREIDWVALSGATDPIDGKKCKMKRFEPGSTTHDLTDEHVLKREAERITVYDRRSGAKLHERTLLADDRCPLVADIKLTGPNAGLRSELTDADRERVFKELRGDPPPPAPPSATASAPSVKPKKPRK